VSKVLKTAIPVVVVAALALSVGVALAQEEPPEPPYGRGLMASYDDVIHQALADALGISLTEFEAARAEGETLADLADSYDVEVAVLFDVMQSARAEALAQAVEDGTISQEQADWILARQANRQGRGLCDGTGQGAGGGGGPMGRR
jgi:hypothetical protein